MTEFSDRKQKVLATVERTHEVCGQLGHINKGYVARMIIWWCMAKILVEG